MTSPRLLKTDKHHSRKTKFTGFVSQHHYVVVAGAKTTVDLVKASRPFSPPVQLRLWNITFEPGVSLKWNVPLRTPEYSLAPLPQLRARVNNLPLGAQLVLILPKIAPVTWLALWLVKSGEVGFPVKVGGSS